MGGIDNLILKLRLLDYDKVYFNLVCLLFGDFGFGGGRRD